MQAQQPEPAQQAWIGATSSAGGRELADCDQSDEQPQRHLLNLPNKSSKCNRPLSISSISSAASSNSSSSSSSSSSSGIHSVLTRNSSLNYSQEEFKRNYSYLQSTESLSQQSASGGELHHHLHHHQHHYHHLHDQHQASDDSNQISRLQASASERATAATGGCNNAACKQSSSARIIEQALKNLNLSAKDNNVAQTRAAILAAGEMQRKSFSANLGAASLTPSKQLVGGSSPTSSSKRVHDEEASKLSRINRSFHASLRYDKSAAYRIHLMANARAFGLGGQAKSYNLSGAQCDIYAEPRGVFRRYSTIARQSSSVSSSDSAELANGRLLCQCRCGAHHKPCSTLSADDKSCSTASFASALSSLSSEAPSNTDCCCERDSERSPAGGGGSAVGLFANKAATLDGATSCERSPSLARHTNSSCSSDSPSNLASSQRSARRGSPKLYQSPSSVSSYSNTSSLFRDDGFEDDLASTTSEHSSSIASSHLGNQIKHYHDLASAKQQLSQTHWNHLLQQQRQSKQQVVVLPTSGPVICNNSQYNRLRIHNEQELPLLSISQRVVTEIIETERSYVEDLEQIVSGYLCKLRDELERHQELFSNLEEIYKFNKDFLFQLEECYLQPGSIAACFVENAAKFDVYTHYCTMYPQVVSTLTDLVAQPATAQLLKERQMELNHCLPLGAYMLKPVQRILKYHILFKSLIKHTTDDESVDEKDRASIGEAFSVMTNIACHINEMKKRHEHSIRVQELQGLLCAWEGPDLTTLGELIIEDTFKIFNRHKSTRHLLLFDNVLLVTKLKRDGTLHYKSHIECSNLMLIETIEGQPLVFNAVPFDNPKALYTFQADNLDKKRDWCLQMKEVIIKSFEVKIPHHVRDLLMSLTKTSSSTNEAKSSSKKSSSSEKTGRVLRAPNYLEKKRSKQLQQASSAR